MEGTMPGTGDATLKSLDWASIRGKVTTSHSLNSFICKMVGCGPHPASENDYSRKAFVNRSQTSERASQGQKGVANPQGTHSAHRPVSQAR